MLIALKHNTAENDDHLSQDLYFKAEIERLRRELTELSDMSDSEHIYSLPLDSENQRLTRAKSSETIKVSETEDEDLPRLEFLQEENSQETYFQLFNSFKFGLKCSFLNF